MLRRLTIPALLLVATPLIAAPFVALAGSSDSGGKARPAVIEVAGHKVYDDRKACTWASGINGWKEVDRRHLIIEGAGRREKFLVEFSGACTTNPGWVSQIGVISRTSRFCGFAGDSLLIDGRRCHALNMWRLVPEAEKVADNTPEKAPIAAN